MQGKRGIVLLQFWSMVIVLLQFWSVANGIIDQSPKGVEKWFDKICYKEEKKTKLHFYYHDIDSGTSPTAVRVAQANMTATSPTSFGFIAVADEPLTVGPELHSAEVGRAQGIYSSADMKELYGFLMTLNLFFTSGEYNGSTLSLLGRDPILHQYQEMPIIGGTGIFRLARGIATVQTYFRNITSQISIFEYNVIVIHY